MKKYFNVHPHAGCYRLLCTGLLLCCAVMGNAQPLSLYDAVNKAITNYPQIRQREAEMKAGQAHITTVKNNMLPSLKLYEQVNLGTDNSLPGSTFSIPVSTQGGIRAENNMQGIGGNIAMSVLDIDVYNFGYKRAENKLAGSEYAVATANLNSDKYLLSEKMISLYLDWLKMYRLLQVANEDQNRAAVILTNIRATVMSGLKPGVDSSTASAQFAQSRIARLQASDNYKNAQIAMAIYTGQDTTALAPDTMAIDKAFAANLQDLFSSDSIAADHPLLDVYQKQYEVQLAQNEATGKKYLPKLSFESAAWMRGSGISYNDVATSDLLTGLSYSRYNYLLGLTLSYNLFDLKHRHDALTEGRYQAKAKQTALETQQLNLNKLMQQVNVSYASTLEKLKELPVQLHSAQAAYAQQLALYRSGLNTLIDLTNAQYVLMQAETAYVVAQDELLQLLHTKAGLSNRLDLFLEKFKS